MNKWNALITICHLWQLQGSKKLVQSFSTSRWTHVREARRVPEFCRSGFGFWHFQVDLTFSAFSAGFSRMACPAFNCSSLARVLRILTVSPAPQWPHGELGLRAGASRVSNHHVADWQVVLVHQQACVLPPEDIQHTQLKRYNPERRLKKYCQALWGAAGQGCTLRTKMIILIILPDIVIGIIICDWKIIDSVSLLPPVYRKL